LTLILITLTGKFATLKLPPAQSLQWLFSTLELAPDVVSDCFAEIFEKETEVIERTNKPPKQRTRNADLERGL